MKYVLRGRREWKKYSMKNNKKKPAVYSAGFF